jgi:hypothetical protein
MLEKTYNAVVQYTLATTAEEVSEVFARLSKAVVRGLVAELDVAGDVHRYDPDKKCAYYFARHENNLAVWSWNEVHRPHEAGELIFLVVSSVSPLDETLANEFYLRATGRTADNPHAASPSDEAAD